MSKTEVPSEVLELLRCPSCKGDLIEGEGELICAAEDLHFPVVDGVPWLTLEDRLKTPKPR